MSRFSFFRCLFLGCAACFLFGLTSPAAFAQRFYVGFSDGTIKVVQADTGSGPNSRAFGSVTHAEGMAVDASGNLFVADSTDNVIYEFRAGARSIFASGLNGVSDIALDSLGNVYAADTNNNQIVAYDPNGRSLGVYGTGAADVEALTFDENDFLFAASQSGSSILEYAPGGGAPTVFASTSAPVTLTWDSNFRNLYVGNGSGSTITMFNRAGIGSPYPAAVNAPGDMTFDLLGNFYVLDSNSAKIFKFTPNGTMTTFATLSGMPTGFVFIPPTGRRFVGKGTINTATGPAEFVVNAVEQKGRKVKGTFEYEDNGAHLVFTTKKLTELNIIGEEAGLSGRAQWHNRSISFVVTGLDLDGTGRRDEFSLRTSAGYSASGPLTTGNLEVANGK